MQTEKEAGHDKSSHEEYSGAVPLEYILAPSPLLTLGAFVVGVGIVQVFPAELLLPGTGAFLLGPPLILIGSLLFGGPSGRCMPTTSTLPTPMSPRP